MHWKGVTLVQASNVILFGNVAVLLWQYSLAQEVASRQHQGFEIVEKLMTCKCQDTTTASLSAVDLGRPLLRCL